MSWSRPCPSRPRRKGTAGIGPGTKSIGTSGVRSTAAPKEIELVLHPVDGLDLAGGPPRLPAVPPRPYSARSPASQESRGNPGAPEYARPAPFRNAIAPYREDLVVYVECIFTWYTILLR